MSPIPAICLSLIFFAAAMSAQAQTRDKKGWHKQSGNSHGIQKGRDGNIKAEFKMDMTFETTITRISSENAKACARHAPNPKPEHIQFCSDALAEPELSAENRYSTTYNMGLMQSKLGDAELAAKTLTEARDLNQDSPEVWLALAKLEVGRGNDAAAMDYVTTALSKNPKRPSQAYITLGHLHERDFAFDEARAAYGAALEANGGSGEARRRLERVNRLWPAK